MRFFSPNVWDTAGSVTERQADVAKIYKGLGKGATDEVLVSELMAECQKQGLTITYTTLEPKNFEETTPLYPRMFPDSPNLVVAPTGPVKSWVIGQPLPKAWEIKKFMWNRYYHCQPWSMNIFKNSNSKN